MIILYVDDDLDDRFIISEVFKEIDPSINCLTVCDGRQAIDFLNNSGPMPDYIFLDINMPVMDGKECLVELKQNKKFKEIPVIIYSTTNDPTEIKSFYRLGASCFMHKPNTFRQLHNMLHGFLDRARDGHSGFVN
ncbi:MAG: response regulator [Chryseosolibacter sp.]